MDKLDREMHMFGMTIADIQEDMEYAKQPYMQGLPMMVMSILSNVQEQILVGMNEQARKDLNVCKYVLHSMLEEERN